MSSSSPFMKTGGNFLIRLREMTASFYFMCSTFKVSILYIQEGSIAYAVHY